MKVVAEAKTQEQKFAGRGDPNVPLEDIHYWRYWAVYEDGSKAVIRKKATRLYPNAFQYDHNVNSGPKPGSLGAQFTFGKNPKSQQYGGNVIATFVIEDPTADYTYHVQVNTYGDGTKDGEPIWTGNAVEHASDEIAAEEARSLFSRWTAVKYWRVIDSAGNVHSTNYEG